MHSSQFCYYLQVVYSDLDYCVRGSMKASRASLKLASTGNVIYALGKKDQPFIVIHDVRGGDVEMG